MSNDSNISSNRQNDPSTWNLDLTTGTEETEATDATGAASRTTGGSRAHGGTDTYGKSEVASGFSIHFDPATVRLPTPPVTSPGRGAPDPHQLPDTPPNAVDEETLTNAYNTAFEKALKGLDPNKYPGLDVGKIRYAQAHPGSTLDTANNKAFLDAQEEATQSVVQQITNKTLNVTCTANQAKKGLPPKTDPEGFKNTVEDALDSAITKLQAQLKKDGKPPLTDPEIDDLVYGFYHPENATQSENLKTINSLVNVTLSEVYTLPTDWAPDTSTYDVVLFDKAGADFDHLLHPDPRSEPTKSLTKVEIQQLLTAYYLPDSMTPSTLPNKLQTIFDNLMGQVKAIMPKSWTNASPTNAAVNAKFYEGEVSASYQYQVQSNLDVYVRGGIVSASDKALVQKAIDHPDDLSIPDNLRTIAKSITDQALSDTKDKYSLAGNWQPTPINIGGFQNPLGPSIINTLETLYSSLQQSVSFLPDSPEKAIYLNFLKVLSEALGSLEEQIYKMESVNAMGASKTALCQRDEALRQIQVHMKEADDQKQKADEAAKKQAKMAKFGKIMSIVGPIMAFVSVLVTIATLGTMGPAMAILMVTISVLSMVDTIASLAGKPLATQEAFLNCIGTLLEQIPGMDHNIADIIGKACVIVASIMAGRASPKALVNAVYAATSIISASGITANICHQAGASEKTTMWTSIGVGAACAIGGMGAQMAGNVGQTATTSAELAADFSKKLEQAAEKSLAKIAEAQKQGGALGAIREAFYTVKRTFQEGEKAAFYAQTVVLKGSGISRFADANIKSNFSRVLRFTEGVALVGNVTAGGVGVAKGVVGYQLQQINAAMAEMIAAAAAQDKAAQSTIDALKQAVKKLEDMMNSFGEWIAQIGQQQSGKYQKFDISYS